MTEQILDNIVQKLERIQVLETELKARELIPYYYSKEKIALAKGLPLETFYFLPYRIWSKVSERYQGNLDLMYENILEFQDYYSKELGWTPLEVWYDDFGIWAKQNGLYWY